MESCKRRHSSYYKLIFGITVVILLLNILLMCYCLSNIDHKQTNHKQINIQTKHYQISIKNTTLYKQPKKYYNTFTAKSISKHNILSNKKSAAGYSNIHHSRTLLNSNNDSLSDYPNDIFTTKQKQDGAIVFHVIGILYMFLGLALVCDEFFVPALHVISTMLNISDDVAGATFMAAGGSAPELFISVIGVFFTDSNVGFGTIVGSAVFNVLFVIGMCAIFSKTLLSLTWWPLLRDSCFYIIALVVLITFFYDQYIKWWEALILFLIYFAYVTFMIFNGRIEKKVKNYIFHRSKSSSCVTPLEEKQAQILLSLSTNLSKNAFRNGALQLVIHTLDPIDEVAVVDKFHKLKHHCIDVIENEEIKSDIDKICIDGTDENENEACIDTLSTAEKFKKESLITKDNASASSSDNIDLGHIDEGSDTLRNADEIIKELDALKSETSTDINYSDGCHRGGGTSPVEARINANVTSNNNSNERFSTHVETRCRSTTPTDANFKSVNTPTDSPVKDGSTTSIQTNSSVGNTTENKHNNNSNVSSSLSLRGSVRFSMSRSSIRSNSHRGITHTRCPSKAESPDNEGEEEEEEGPVDLSWPDSCVSRTFYIVKLPLLLLLCITLPDVRRPKHRRFFAITFFGCIVWIGFFTYLMVWWAAEIGDVADIPIDVMGLTFLAAGTSIPDLITSVVVARQGLGDMAVSSSIGSNIFDVTVGLPLPWLLNSISRDLKPVFVQNDGLFCATILLFMMLLAVIATIALNKWKMTKLLGATMFALYVVFITVTLLIQLNVWSCPI